MSERELTASPSGQLSQSMSSIPGAWFEHLSSFLEWIGDLAIFLWQVVRAAVTPPFEFRELVRQLDEIGSMSLPLVAAAGAAIRAVLSLEARYSLTRLRGEINASRRNCLLRYSRNRPDHYRLDCKRPSRRSCDRRGVSGDEGYRADRCYRGASAVNPYKLLAVTRILACILMLPLLTLAADFCGVLAGWPHWQARGAALVAAVHQ